MTMSTLPSARPAIVAACAAGATKRDSRRTSSGKAANRCENVPVVLGGEDGRRDEDRDLLAVLDRLERGPQRHLGLAVADVADDEPVHRPDQLHVGLDLGAGARSWSIVSSYGKDASISACHGLSGPNAWPRASAREAYSARSSSARSSTALRTRCLARSHSVPPSFESAGRSPPE